MSNEIFEKLMNERTVCDYAKAMKDFHDVVSWSEQRNCGSARAHSEKQRERIHEQQREE